MIRVLWVEDEKDHFSCFSWALNKDSYDIQLARNYSEAKQLLKADSYDVYVIDVILASGIKPMTIKDLDHILDTYYGIEFIKDIIDAGGAGKIIVVSVVNEKQKLDIIKSLDDNINIMWKYDTSSEDIKNAIDKIVTKNEL